jgi:hypothetical protein
MNDEARISVGFAAAAVAFSALFLGASSCAKNMEREVTKRHVACVQAGGQYISANCVRSRP